MAPAPKRSKPAPPPAHHDDRDDSASEPYSDELLSGSASPELLVTGGAGEEEELSSGEELDDSLDEDEDDVEDESADEADAAKKRMANVSFGALAKAKVALDAGREAGPSKKRKREAGEDGEAEAKLRALRERLREIQAGKKARDGGAESKKAKDFIALDGRSSGEEDVSDDSDSDDSADEKQASAAPKSRSSKHAPQIQSAKRAVTRKRPVVELAKSTQRDPRFDPLTGTLDVDKVSKKYAFVHDYQTSEIQALRKQLKDPKSSRLLTDGQKDDLKRQILVLESKQRSARDKERTRDVVREHRKAEKEAVKEGKKPFYLKGSEVKKEALVKKFEGMKGKEREKTVDRRRKKIAAKEKKSMPRERRRTD